MSSEGTGTPPDDELPAAPSGRCKLLGLLPFADLGADVDFEAAEAAVENEDAAVEDAFDLGEVDEVDAALVVVVAVVAVIEVAFAPKCEEEEDDEESMDGTSGEETVRREDAAVLLPRPLRLPLLLAMWLLPLLLLAVGE